jgi:tRNA threonylcarbamoyladenosine biosynthesis protein TsaE
VSDPLTITTASPDETEALGHKLAGILPRGATVALHGDLASGKTCLVRGMASYFHREESVHSPTFTLINEYGNDPKLYHIDLYRLNSTEAVADLGITDLFGAADIVVVEWAERAEGLLPRDRLNVFLEHAGGDTRTIRFENTELLPADWRDQHT